MTESPAAAPLPTSAWGYGLATYAGTEGEGGLLDTWYPSPSLGDAEQDPTVDPGQQRELVLGAVRSAFKPEFLNRLDEIVVFEALSTDDLAHIVDLQVAQPAKRLAPRRLELDVTKEARDWLARTGYDPVYGARPLRRLVQSAIGDQLARALLAGEIRDGDTVVVDVDESDSSLRVTAPVHAH